MTQCGCGKVIKEAGRCCGADFIECPVCGQFTDYTDLCDSCYNAKHLNPETSRKLLEHVGYTKEQIDPGLAKVLPIMSKLVSCGMCPIYECKTSDSYETDEQCLKELWEYALCD